MKTLVTIFCIASLLALARAASAQALMESAYHLGVAVGQCLAVKCMILRGFVVTESPKAGEPVSIVPDEIIWGAPVAAGPLSLPYQDFEHLPKGDGAGGRNVSEKKERVSNDAPASRKRVVFTQGGKGGVGKTGFMIHLAEWFVANQIPFTLLDLDTENKSRGSLKHYFNGLARKINIHTEAGLDMFIDCLSEGAPVILADMGAGSGQVALNWFETMYPYLAKEGILFTAIGVVTSDPASVESVLSWAARLQSRVQYVIVENATSQQADFAYWRESDQSARFREVFQPVVLSMEYRLAELENASRQYGVTLAQIAQRKTDAPDLQKASFVIREQSYRRRLFQEFEKAKEFFLP